MVKITVGSAAEFISKYPNWGYFLFWRSSKKQWFLPDLQNQSLHGFHILKNIQQRYHLNLKPYPHIFPLPEHMMTWPFVLSGHFVCLNLKIQRSRVRIQPLLNILNYICYIFYTSKVFFRPYDQSSKKTKIVRDPNFGMKMSDFHIFVNNSLIRMILILKIAPKLLFIHLWSIAIIICFIFSKKISQISIIRSYFWSLAKNVWILPRKWPGS